MQIKRSTTTHQCKLIKLSGYKKSTKADLSGEYYES